MLIFDSLKHGMGKLRITENGIRLEGEAEFLDSLYTNKIQSVQVHVKDKYIYQLYSLTLYVIFTDGIKGPL